jgi:hypothetical protein
MRAERKFYQRKCQPLDRSGRKRNAFVGFLKDFRRNGEEVSTMGLDRQIRIVSRDLLKLP